MKLKKIFTLTLSLPFFLSPSLHAETRPNLADVINFKSKEVLTAIDNECGDTWCEGAEFTFNKFSCTNNVNKTTCVLEYESHDYNHPLQEIKTIINPGPGDVFNVKAPIVATKTLGWYYDGKCEITGFTNMEQLLKTDSRSPSLGEYLYEQLTECISANQKAIR